ncbi:MAG: diguanylate cyclase [Hyphomicrobiaceae bacterium]
MRAVEKLSPLPAAPLLLSFFGGIASTVFVGGLVWAVAVGSLATLATDLGQLLAAAAQGFAFLLAPVFTTTGLSILALVAVGAAIVAWRQYRSSEPQPAAEMVLEAAPSHTSAPQRTELQLKQELSHVLKLVRGFLESNNRYARTLAEAQQTLSHLPKPDQVWTIVRLLMEENDRMRRDSSALRVNLEQSQSQIEQLRSSLTVAEEAALRDPLTSLGNRRHLDVVLAKAIEEAHADKTALCLVMGDLDDFKKINDKLGHAAGDEILKRFADLMLKNVKGRDRVARYGGEEFAIVLPQTAMGNAYHLTEQIRSQLETASWTVGRTGQPVGKLTASFGIAQLNDADNPVSLIERADQKLYDAKRNGRNRIAIERSLAA